MSEAEVVACNGTQGCGAGGLLSHFNSLRRDCPQLIELRYGVCAISLRPIDIKNELVTQLEKVCATINQYLIRSISRTVDGRQPGNDSP